MSYDETLATRVRAVLAGEGSGFDERRMFGGLTFKVGGHMCVGVLGDQLMVRVGKAAHAATIALDHARAMDFTGQPSTSTVYVAPAGIVTERALATWVARGLAVMQTLPPK